MKPYLQKLLLLAAGVLLVAAASAQQHSATLLTGTVTDASDAPVIGASVVLKGSNTGATTSSDGTFTLRDADPKGTLVVSFLGYDTVEVPVNGATNLKIRLQESDNTLEEVVVVGFGTQKKKNLTGAVSTIDAKELNNRPVVSAANALQGLDPSVNLTMGTGSPESSYQVDIRGAISINSGSPLILVDGVEASLRQVNPNDIESVSVLKDASASAIYGAKASAGVILVTTKSGSSEQGKAKVSYSGRFGWAQNTTATDFITCSYDYVNIVNRFYNSINGYDFYLFPEANGEMQKLLDRRNDKHESPERPWVEVGSDGKYYYYANFDWFGYLFNRTRTQHEHNVSISGGTDKFNYYVSGRYLDQTGVFRIYGDTYKDISFRTKMNAKLSKRLTYSNNISFDRSQMKFPGRPEYEQTISAMYTQVAPMFIPRNPDGTIVAQNNQAYSFNLGSGMLGAMTANNTENSKTIRYIIISNQLDFEIAKGLKLTGAYAYRMRDPINRYRNNTYDYSTELGVIKTYTAGSVENAYTENRYSETQGNLDLYATYNAQWGADKRHNFTAVAGMQYIDYDYSTLQVKQTNLASQDLSSFAVASGEIKLQQTLNQLRTMGAFVRVNYDYDGRYLFEVSGRADGSSRFAAKNRWGFFPSASAGWRISEEKFFQPVSDVWNNFKLRLSVGSLGNQQVSGYYTYIDSIDMDNTMSYTFDGSSKANYASVSAPISSNLTWETVTTYNLGVDMSFLNNRLSLSTDFYIRDTKDMLTTSMTLPDVYGAPTPKSNSADLRTKGYEIYLRWNDRFTLAGKPFRYGITATFGDYLTKITKFYNPDKVLSDYYEGMTLGEIWGYSVDGLFRTDEEAAAYSAEIDDSLVNNRVYISKGPGESVLHAGDVRFKDLNGDGVISTGANTLDKPGDRRVIGNRLPRYSYSFRVDLSWNNFDISAFFQGVGRRNWYPASGQASYSFWGPYAQPMVSFIDKDFESLCWSEENPGGYFPRQRGYQAYGNGSLGTVNDRYIQNVGYLRLKNLTVGYTVPLKKCFIERLRVSLSGENLWYWSPLKKYCKTVDPELALSTSTYNSNSGVGYFYSRTFSINLDLTF